jgi:tetratricopeptide (TPR) repeat protein
MPLRLDQTSAASFLGRGQVGLARRDADQALADFTQALKANPRDPAGYFERGRAWALQGEYAKAALDFEATLQQR